MISPASGGLAQHSPRKWPTRLRKLLAGASGADARAKAKQMERESGGL